MRVHLYRDSFDTPWGFRLQGGKDLNQPLVVQRVFSNTPAEGELQRGDRILSINNRDSRGLTHKQAQDQIKFGGGQIELEIERPSDTNIPLLNPHAATRAPSNIPPKKISPIVIPIKKPEQTMSFPGHVPTKVTMNKFGGGTQSFGVNYGNKPAAQHQPVRSPVQSYPQPYSAGGSDSAFSPTFQISQPQFQQYSPPSPQQQYRAPPQQYQPPQQQQPQRQFTPPRTMRQFSQEYPVEATPKHRGHNTPRLSQSQLELQNSQPSYVRSDDPLEEEEYNYVPVSQMKNRFMEKPKAPPQRNSRQNSIDSRSVEEEEDDYPNAPVLERRRLFMQDQPKQAIQHNRTARPFRQRPADSSSQNYGVDYSKPHQPHRPQPVSQKPRPAPQPFAHAPPHQTLRQDEPDSSAPWKNTLRASDIPKPWEMEQQEYIMPGQMERQQQPARPSPAVQVQSRATVPAPAQSSSGAPARQITVRDQGQGSQQSTSVSEQKSKNADERDWNNSYVYRMVHEETSRPRAPPPVSPKPQLYQQPQQENYNDGYNNMDMYGTDF